MLVAELGKWLDYQRILQEYRYTQSPGMSIAGAEVGRKFALATFTKRKAR